MIPKHIKTLIKEHLRKLTEADKFIPQDYSAEFNQTGSGKAITGTSNKDTIPTQKLNEVLAQLAMAKNAVNAYKQAYKNNEPTFNINWMGQKLIGKIPESFRNAKDPNGNNIDYLYYFDVPSLGDGGFQYKLYKNGFLQAAQVQPRSNMNQNPNLSMATDAGYNKEYDDRIKYFYVKAGILGKYQNETKVYSVFPTPAIDGAIKVRFTNYPEIVDFLTKDKGIAQYTADEKGSEISNKMTIDKKIEKIRKDAELEIKRPLSSNTIWMEFKQQLMTLSPEQQQTLDISKTTQDFIKTYRSQNPNAAKSTLSMPSDELAAWDREQKEKMARIAAAKARRK